MYCNQKKMATLIAILQDAVCQAMTNDDPDDILFSFVARIGSFLGAGKAFLFDDTPIHFYCWTPDGMTYDTDRVIPNEDRQKLRGWFKDLASRGHPVFIAITADWPDLDSSIKEHMHRAHIHNVAAMAFSCRATGLARLSWKIFIPMQENGPMNYSAWQAASFWCCSKAATISIRCGTTVSSIR